MVYYIPGTHKCGITDDLTVTEDGKVVYKFTGEPVTLELLGKKVTKEPRWLYGIALVGQVDQFDVDHLHFVFNPQSRSKFPWYAWYDTPKVVYDKYRVVPGYSNIAVSEDGIPIDSSTGEPFKISVSHNYRHVYCYISRYNKELFVPVYKLVALAWLKNDTPITKYVVNHRDGTGVPLNDHASNLEWTTYKGNAIHAVENGLTPFSCGCRVRDIYTGEIKSFPSISHMVDAFGAAMNRCLGYYLNRRGNKLIGDRWEIRIDGDDRPWIYAQNWQNVEPGRYVITVTEPTGDKVFNGVRTLISHYHLWNLPSWSCKEAVKRLLEEHPDFKVSVNDQYDTRPIEVKDLETGNITVYASYKEMIAKTHWCLATTIAAVNCQGTRTMLDRYVLRRQTSDPWPDIQPNKSRAIELELTNKRTHETTICSSLKEAARFTGRDRDHIKRCIERPKETDKYVIRRITPASSGDR